MVRVLHLHVISGSEVVRRSLIVRICQEVRTSDLIASEGRDEFRILLTSPDAEQAEAIAGRIEQLAAVLNRVHPDDGEPLRLRVRVEVPHAVDGEEGPCDPCDEHIVFNGAQLSSALRPSGGAV